MGENRLANGILKRLVLQINGTKLCHLPSYMSVQTKNGKEFVGTLDAFGKCNNTIKIMFIKLGAGIVLLLKDTFK